MCCLNANDDPMRDPDNLHRPWSVPDCWQAIHENAIETPLDPTSANGVNMDALLASGAGECLEYLPHWNDPIGNVLGQHWLGCGTIAGFSELAVWDCDPQPNPSFPLKEAQGTFFANRVNVFVWNDIPEARHAEIDDAMQSAWRLLLEQIDVAVWAACLADERLGSCVSDAIRDPDWFRLDVTSEGRPEPAVEGDVFNDGDWVEGFAYADSSDPAYWKFWWNCEGDLAGACECDGVVAYYVCHDQGADPLEACCARVWLASVILHEMLHKCAEDLGYDDRDSIGPPGVYCGIAVTITNTFLWAIAQRFPELANSNCSLIFAPSMFIGSGIFCPTAFDDVLGDCASRMNPVPANQNA